MKRRETLQALGAFAWTPLSAAPESLELRIGTVSPVTVRLTLAAPGAKVADNGSMLPAALVQPRLRISDLTRSHKVTSGDLRLSISPGLSVLIEDKAQRTVQQIRIDPATGAIRFRMAGPVLGLGEGGPQFDRRGSVDEMRNGQGAYRERTHGARVPIPWLIGTEGWGMFINQPWGKFDFTQSEGHFLPSSGLPLDVFIVGSAEPAVILREYGVLTGYADMPPLWSFGYQQSHRTLASREEILSVASTFREKKLPCDVLIYLGTGFCPSGWNTGHGSFTFNKSVFPDPAAVFRELHEQNFKVALHTVYREPRLRGDVKDGCSQSGTTQQAACYWEMHRQVSKAGVDGWWPDEGDQLDVVSRLARDRMYYDGPIAENPNVRPYSLHRNAYAGTQRFGAFVWSGDVGSMWETLAVHVPVAINTGLSGLPFWGTDTGGFVPTKELTSELYVRWFQFSAFNPLFRSHGKTWKLRLPWQWNSGDLGPSEIEPGRGGADHPNPAELRNPDVEPICRKYLELRYRLMPYLYSIVRECHETGLPLMRALWIHYPLDAEAVKQGNEYLWGRDILVAPVVEKGAKSRTLYLPRDRWYDFWTNEPVEGGRELSRNVDLATMPLYVRAGAIIPFGPVRQYTVEKSDAPVELSIYPGANGKFVLYEDDGVTFDFRKGRYSKFEFAWNDAASELTVRGPRVAREFKASVITSGQTQTVAYKGTPLGVRFVARVP